MSRRGLRASSPRVADASNPANDRNANTTPRKTAEVSLPGSIEKTLRSKVWPPGAVPPISRTATTIVTITMSATVVASAISRKRVPPFAGCVARNQTSASTIAPIGNPSHSGACFQTEFWMSVVRKIPDAMLVTAP